MSQLLYVYGIVPSNQSLKELKTIHLGSLAALVEEVSDQEFGEEALAENIKNMEWVSEKAVHHQEVLATAGSESTLVPLKFGRVFSSEESIQSMLKEKERYFTDLLHRLDGKQEWGLKLFFNPATLQSWLEKNNHEIKEADEQISGLSSGAAFLLKKKREQLIKEKVKKEVNTYRKSVFTLCKEQSEELVQNKELDSKLSGNPDTNLLNLALLIQPNQFTALEKELSTMLDDNQSQGLYHELTGPWPPYNFVNL
ncbi:MAG: GvpL/GvpF family gas vesicle protein [Bacteroidota bacterium]